MMHKLIVGIGSTNMIHVYGDQPDGWTVQSDKGKILVCKYKGKYPKFKFEVFDNIKEGAVVFDTNDGYVAYRHKEMQRVLDYYGIDKTYKIRDDTLKLKIFENLDGSFKNQIYGYKDIEFIDCLSAKRTEDKITHVCRLKFISDKSFIFVKDTDGYTKFYHKGSIYYLAVNGYLLNMNTDLTNEFKAKAFLANHQIIE